MLRCDEVTDRKLLVYRGNHLVRFEELKPSELQFKFLHGAKIGHCIGECYSGHGGGY